jgi:formate/nitrite transporter FocA (FNT family)
MQPEILLPISTIWIGYGVMIAGIVIAQLQFRKIQGNVMTYGQALRNWCLTMLFASVITGFFTYLLYALIDPSLQEQLRLAIEEQIVKQGRVPEDQIDTAVEMASKFQKPPMMFLMGIFGGTFIGLIISLLTSIFTQRKPLLILKNKGNINYRMDISIVIPLYNEEESLPELAAWIRRVMNDHGFSYEVIMIDDGSQDNSWETIRKLKQKIII